MITDRDIACRAVAEGKDGTTPVRQVMSSPAVTVSADTSVEDWWLALVSGDDEQARDYARTRGTRAAEVMTRPAGAVPAQQQPG